MLWIAFTSLAALAVVGVVLWIRWLGRKGNVPMRTLIIANIIAGAPATVGIFGSCVGAFKSFGAVGGESVDPSQKARILGEGIAEAMNCAVMGLVVAFVGVVGVMLTFTWKFAWSNSNPKNGGGRTGG